MFLTVFALAESLPVGSILPSILVSESCFPFQNHGKDRASKLTEGLVKIGVSRVDKYSERKTFFFLITQRKVVVYDSVSQYFPKRLSFFQNRTDNNIFAIVVIAFFCFINYYKNNNLLCKIKVKDIYQMVLEHLLP